MIFRRRKSPTRRIIAFAASFIGMNVWAAPRDVNISQSSQRIGAYDFVEVKVDVAAPDAANCFTDVVLSGEFHSMGSNPVSVRGFCDSADGSVYRIRFMPSKAGDYSFEINFEQGSYNKKFSGTFQATESHRRGPIRVDKDHPWHFVWEGTGEHFFFNGTTAFWLMGWQDERVIQYSIERLHRLSINRMRACIAGRTSTFYGEPVMNGKAWSVWLTPFEAEHTSDFSHPGFNWKKFNVAYWQKYDRMLQFARDHDMIMSLVLDMNDNAVHPDAGSEDEHRYVRYAVDRLGAFSNITWDLGDDLESFRDDKWTHDTGTLIKSWDPYKHLATSHPVKDVHQDRTSDWFDFTSFQEWSRDQHRYILAQRKKQQELGRIIPQTNEEYGYEDHYPLWAPGLGSESADVLRRTAWDIYMAGGYQTAGETARRGTNIFPDSGGGWMNGRGDYTMTMFVGYSRIVDFFSSFEWWKTDPHDELVTGGAYCLSVPGQVYAIYLPKSGKTQVRLEPGSYQAKWFNPLTGEWTAIDKNIQVSSWESPSSPDYNDWAMLITRNP